METSLWEWAEARGLSVRELAETLGYEPGHLYKLQRGDYPVTETFKARVVLALGEGARALFSDNPTAPASGAE